jgi:predicted transcriptional regulator of viral defense system
MAKTAGHHAKRSYDHPGLFACSCTPNPAQISTAPLAGTDQKRCLRIDPRRTRRIRLSGYKSVVHWSYLVSPYYFSFATAAFFHDLSTQAAATVYIATSKIKGQQLLTVRDRTYRLVILPEHKFFGAMEVDAYGSRVWMAEREKTIIDALDHPEHAGDIPEIAGMLWRSQGQLDWTRIADYALKMQSQSLVQRLGYLADYLLLPWPAEIRGQLRTNVGKTTAYLGRVGQWGQGGDYDATWHIIDNVPQPELRAEIEVH